MNPKEQLAGLKRATDVLEGMRVFVTSRQRIKKPEGDDLFDEAIADLRNLAAILATLPEPGVVSDEAVWMFKDTDGKWQTFLNDKHREDTIADGRWEVRQFNPADPAGEVVECQMSWQPKGMHEKTWTCRVCGISIVRNGADGHPYVRCKTQPAPPAQGFKTITPDWVIGYFPSDVDDSVKQTIRDAFAEYKALNAQGFDAEVVGTVTRAGAFEVDEHRIELAPEFDERLNNLPEGAVVKLYASPVRDLAVQEIDVLRALAAAAKEPDYVDIANRLQDKLGVGVMPSTVKEVLVWKVAKEVGRG